jgi:hypothetical protein
VIGRSPDEAGVQTSSVASSSGGASSAEDGMPSPTIDRMILEIEPDVRSCGSGVMPWIASAIRAHRQHQARIRGESNIESSIPVEDDETRSDTVGCPPYYGRISPGTVGSRPSIVGSEDGPIGQAEGRAGGPLLDPCPWGSSGSDGRRTRRIAASPLHDSLSVGAISIATHLPHGKGAITWPAGITPAASTPLTGSIPGSVTPMMPAASESPAAGTREIEGATGARGIWTRWVASSSSSRIAPTRRS